MAMKQLQCPSCQATIAVDAAGAGDIVTCPSCDKQFRLRRRRSTTPPPAPPAASRTAPANAPSDSAASVLSRTVPDVPDQPVSVSTGPGLRWRRWSVIVFGAVAVCVLAFGLFQWFGRNSAQRRAVTALRSVQQELDAGVKAASHGDTARAEEHLDNAIGQLASIDRADVAVDVAAVGAAVAKLDTALGKAATPKLRGKLATVNSGVRGLAESMQIPAAEDDVIWVCSVPAGADVWLAYDDEISAKDKGQWSRMIEFAAKPDKANALAGGSAPFLFKARHFRGTTPLVLRARPGKYAIGVQLPIRAEFGNVGLKEFPYYPTEAREFIRATDGTMTAYMRVYFVEKRANQGTFLNTAFCPRTATHDEFLAAAFPDGDNFTIDTAKISAALRAIGDDRWPKDERLTAPQIAAVVKSLRRFGTATWPLAGDKKDVFYIAGLRHANVITVAKGAFSANIFKPMSIPTFTPPSIPNFNIPPVTMPKINVPSIPTFNPNLGRTSGGARRRAPKTDSKPPSRRKPNTSTRPPSPRSPTTSRQTATPKPAPATLERRANGKLQAARNFIAMEKMDLARQWFEELIRDYPDTEAAAEARKELERLP